MRRIGYYVHHHGEGHRKRALAVANYEPNRFTLLGTGLQQSADIASIALPDDRIEGAAFDGRDHEQHRAQSLHYAPLGHDGIRQRMSALAGWIAAAHPALIVVDVSVEVAMLARLCATPVAYVRLGGRRDDLPHLEAFRAASVLIAPFAQALDDPDTPAWIREKTIYAPGLVSSRVDAEPQSGSVLVVCGRGGSTISLRNLIDAARRTPHHRWRMIGFDDEAHNLPPNLVVSRWSDDPEGEIARAEIVVGGAGDGLVGAVLAARRPFICIPEPRPFDEQRSKAAALQRAGAAMTFERWPHEDDWSHVLESARGIDPHAQAALDDRNGPARLAGFLIELAERQK